jgi:putative heme-binding domain-containing protein
MAADREPALRAWAARLGAADLNEQFRLHRDQVPDEQVERVVDALEKLAADREPSVRVAVATACRQLVSGSLTIDTEPMGQVPFEKVLVALIMASARDSDPLLNFMIWQAGEPGFARDPQTALDWIADNATSTMPLGGILARKGMRRLCDTQDKVMLNLAVDFLEKVAPMDSDLALAAIEGLIEGQRAKPLKPGVPTKTLFETLANSTNARVRQRGEELGTLWGDARSIAAILRAVADQNLASPDRVRAIAVARQMKNDSARAAFLAVVTNQSPDEVTVEALRGLGEAGGENGATELLELWDRLGPRPRAAAAEVMASRRPWAVSLLEAVEAKKILASELPMTVVRSLGESRDDFIRQRALQAIGRIRPANADKQKIIEQKKQMILSGTPDLAAGHELARKTCLVCHKLYGEGAEVGPDLTGVGRSSLDALLANVIDPNQVVGKGYENVEIETKDGRSISGRMVENNDARIRLLSSGPKEEVVAKSDVASLRVSELSVMPEGLEQMPETDFRNLILFILQPPQEQNAKK